MTNFHQRYLSGEYISVWNEIRTLGSHVRSSQYKDDVIRVVEATTNRIRHNVDILINNLKNDGYQFTWPGHDPYEFDRSRWLPNQESQAMVDFLNNLCGPIPLIIEAWIKYVGDVHLVGNHPKWSDQDMFTDALVVDFEYKAWKLDESASAQSYFQSEYDFWKEDTNHGENAESFHLPFAPDVNYKIGVSGNGCYSILLPDSGADAMIEMNGKRLYFLDYLRNCFAFGGFPGFAETEKGNDNNTITQLKKGLLDF